MVVKGNILVLAYFFKLDEFVEVAISLRCVCFFRKSLNYLISPDKNILLINHTILQKITI
jgi:hypothetical protein